MRWRPEKVLTYGPEVAEVNAAAGFEPDPQQQLGLDLIFAVGEDGRPLTFEFCVICCRQNLKTGLFKQTAVGWIVVLEEPDVVWSAHEMGTTRDAQNELADLFRSPTLNGWMLPQKNEGVYTENGEERLELRDPETGEVHKIWFKARTATGGRGLARGKLILDEAFALQASMMGSLMPIMLTKPRAQVVYGSSAGKADSAVLREIRMRGKKHVSPRLTYLEWMSKRENCKDPDCTHPKDAVARKLDCALDREHLWRKANPTISTGRITMDSIRDQRQALPAAEFMRECLGWWDEPEDGAGPPAINLSRWGRLSNPKAPAPSRAVIVLDVEPDLSASTVAVVGQTSYAVDGKTVRRVLLMEQHKPGTGWVLGAVKKLRENLEVLEVSLHPSGQAKVLIPKLKNAGIEFHKLTHQDMAGGTAAIRTAIEDESIVHLGQTELDAAATTARIRKIQESQLWDRSNPVPLGPLVATATGLPRWELRNAEKPPPPPPPPVKAGPARRSRSDDIAHVGF